MSSAELKNKYFDTLPFLKGSDLKRDTDVTIEKFEEITTRVSKKPRPCLRLKNYEAPLGLNVTNFERMCEKFGEDTKKWSGRKITLKRVLAPNPQEGGKETASIRIA